MNYDFSWFHVERAFPTLLEGLWVTLELTLWANIIGLVLGFIVAIGMMSKIKVITWPLTLYIEFFRCTPALIQLVWFFFCVPILFNVWWSAQFMGLLALGLNLAAFNSEAYRAAIQAIPESHTDASTALGLNGLQRIFFVILPQALLLAMPVLITNGIGIFQQSALVALISVEDLMYQGRYLSSQTFRPIETLTLVALMYFAVSFPVSLTVTYLERRTKRLLAT
ncbi:polar amino acid transport system permease protein [Monaibacterium marinum]|uniref:Polar amino acid transport system permease protein n=1 Tax=Pontivivens marinum TaxID=1690039 RepID=A0A2C9CUI7_9RHOB|nr:amino acid ABC transporter permease [Monaibacterium marinum]SOH94898.1 polar amino acid transport system permease protein [Monaibacterium marinum]